jgi:cell division protein FtsW
MIVSQAFSNIAVVCGAFPATGIPLPFFSAGGSSIVTTLVSAGLIVNVTGKGNPPTTGINYMRYNDSERNNGI